STRIAIDGVRRLSGDDPTRHAGLYDSLVSAENLEIVRRTVKAVGEGDLQSAFENLDAAIELDQSRPTGIYKGLDGLQEAICRWSEVWTEKHVEAEEFIDAGDEIVAITHEYARSVRTGMALDRSVVEVSTLRGAKA